VIGELGKLYSRVRNLCCWVAGVAETIATRSRAFVLVNLFEAVESERGCLAVIPLPTLVFAVGVHLLNLFLHQDFRMLLE
jgi:hypothetical protein